MADDLQAPGTDESPDWDSLYRYRGPDEMVIERPILTGDIFVGVPVRDEEGVFALAVLQHPCAIRRGALNRRILCAEVVPAAALSPSKWKKEFFRVMPLPMLRPDAKAPHYEVKFENFHVAESAKLLSAERIACLDLVGINLLLQRWVHHNSRVAIPTDKYFRATVGQYAEADIIEEWCVERAGVSVENASSEADAWLSAADGTGAPRRARLKDDEFRARMRRDARAEVRRRNGDFGSPSEG